MTTQKLQLQRVEGVDKGGQDVFVDIAVNYRVKDTTIPERMYQEVGANGNMEFIVNRLAIPEKVQEGFKQVSVQYEALAILENRDEVRAKAITRIEELFPKEYFEIQSITLSNIDYQQSFKDAIQLKKDNVQLALAAQEAVKRSQYEAEQKIEEAKGQAESKKLTADAIAYELKVQRQQITPLMAQMKWIEKWQGNVPSTMIGSQGSGMDTNLLLQLPTAREEKAFEYLDTYMNYTG